MSQLTPEEIKHMNQVTESVDSLKTVMKHGKWLADTYLYNLNNLDISRMSKDQLEGWIKYSVESLSSLSHYLEENSK